MVYIKLKKKMSLSDGSSPSCVESVDIEIIGNL